MRFRLVFYDTDAHDKYNTEHRFEYFGDRDSIWNLWYLLYITLNKRHVEVYSLDGRKMNPEDGYEGMTDYHI